MAQNLDDPEVKRRLVSQFLRLTPFMFIGCWLLAALQGASASHSTLIAGVAAAGALGTALSIHLFGSGSRHVLTAVMVILAILGFLAR